MKFILVALMSVSFLAAQEIDFSSLDHFAKKAKESNVVSLNQDQLQAALSMFADKDTSSKEDRQQLQNIVRHLSSVQVRNFEFDKPGLVRDEDLAGIRKEFSSKLKGWSKIVDSKEETEHSEIYLHTDHGHTVGLAVISVEETELSVILLRGAPEMSDLGALGGVLGIPSMQLGPAAAK